MEEDFFTAKTFESDPFYESLIYICILSVFGTALAKVFFFKLVQISTPVFATSVTYLMPIVAVIWGLIDGETFTPLQAVATVIILTGVYIANKKRK